jgi:hypothetical protein
MIGVIGDLERIWPASFITPELVPPLITQGFFNLTTYKKTTKKAISKNNNLKITGYAKCWIICENWVQAMVRVRSGSALGSGLGEGLGLGLGLGLGI